jgi:hypothetical protein
MGCWIFGTSFPLDPALTVKELERNVTDLNFLALQIHQTAKEKGFWDEILLDPESGLLRVPPPTPKEVGAFISEKLCLIHSEVSEALEDHRRDQHDHMAEELADVLIRVLDLSAFMNYNIAAAVSDKMEKNQQRERMHGKSR